MMPVFFVGFSSVIQNNSLISLSGQILLALIGTALFAYTIHKLKQTRIVYKGLILISIPLLFVLGFVLLVNQQKRIGEQAEKWELHSKEVITYSLSLSKNLTNAESNIRGYVITGDPDYRENYELIARKFPEEVKLLRNFVSDNPQQLAMIEDIKVKASERLAALTEIKNLVNEGKLDEASARIRSGVGKHLMSEFQNQMDTFLAEAANFNEIRRKDVQDSWQRFDWLLVAGASADLLLAFTLAFLFTRSIGRRLQTLTENAQALANGNNLAQPLSGKDEVAKLDKTFHQMARALQKARDELEFKVEERTLELSQANEMLRKQITERQKAEEALRESEKRYRHLFENNPLPMWVYDIETLDFLAVNDAAAFYYGYSQEEFLSMTIKDIRPPEDIPILVENVLGSSSGINNGNGWRHRKKDGSIIDVEITSHELIFDGKRSRLVLANDVTDRKRAEIAILQLNQTLEQRVSERTSELEAANKELEAFSYSVSHDLRAPLRAIDGFSRIFLEDYADKLDDEGRRVLDVIRNNAQNMGQLIDDLLAFSRLGRKQIEPTKIDMRELAQDVCAHLESSSDSNIKIEQLPATEGDRALLRQVFVNLISNAVKYSGTKENTPIEVGGRTENGENIYYVRDQGVGFDMKYANKLFGVFQRLHSVEEFEGTGVGLAIVQRIVHRHGGRVWAEAEVGKGATFYFSLPQNGLNDRETNNGHQGSRNTVG
jgi:PAS domain S-box-containing protein